MALAPKWCGEKELIIDKGQLQKAVPLFLEETAKDAAANQLKSYLKDAEAGTVGGRKMTWKQISKSTVGARKLQSERPEIYKDYLRQSSYRRLSVA